LIRGITPGKIHRHIEELCKELAPNYQPNFLEFFPEEGAEVNDCFNIVKEKVEHYNGEIRYGWEIWEIPSVMVEAEFHCVWRDPSGTLHDITPKPPPIKKILFLPDPAMTYEGRQVNNIRRAICSEPVVLDFIKVCDEEFELKNRGSRAYEHGQIVLEDAEAEEMENINIKKADLGMRIQPLIAKPGRNDPCLCGSGKKFKKCCGI